jgi:hypothetical protein
MAGLAPGNAPAALPRVAEVWIQGLVQRGKREGLLTSADEATALAAGLRALLLSRRGAPGMEIWHGTTGEGRFVLNLPAFLDAGGDFDAHGYRAACALAIQALDIWGNGVTETLSLGFADMAGLLAGFDLAYDSDAARDVAAAIAALTRGAAEAESGRLAQRFGARHAPSLIRAPAPLETVVPGLAKAAQAALDAAADVPGLRHRAFVVLAPADAVELLLGAESAGVAPASATTKPVRAADGSIQHVPTRAAELAGPDANWLLAYAERQARHAMEAAVMPFLDGLPAELAAVSEGFSLREAFALPKREPRARSWRVTIAGSRVGLRVLEDELGNLREVSFSLPRESAVRRSLIEALAQAVSLGLSQGVPLSSFVNSYAYTPGNGGMVEGDPSIRRATSLLDWAFRRLALDYLDRDDLTDPVEEAMPEPRPTILPLLPLELPAHPSPRMRRQLTPAA